MKIALWHNNADIRIEEVPEPRPGPREMVVKILSCGICGSDIVEWYRLPRAPLVQGHEIGAEVVSAGDAVRKFKLGDRVFIAPKVPCLECKYCEEGHHAVCSSVKDRLPGGFAEYALVPEALVETGTYLLPDNVSYDHSTLIEPLACVIRAQRLAGIKAGQTVLVMGCGMAGLLHVKLAKLKHCTVIATDINDTRLAFAKNAGADIVIDAGDNIPERLAAATGRRAGAVMLCTSSLAAIDQAWKSVDKGGAVVFFAVPPPEKCVTVPINDFWTKEIRILTSYYCGPPDITAALEMIASKAVMVDDMITHRLPLRDTARGFQLVLEGKESIKVIIKPHQAS